MTQTKVVSSPPLVKVEMVEKKTSNAAVVGVGGGGVVDDSDVFQIASL